MKLYLMFFIIFMAFEVQASNTDLFHSYKKVNEVQMVSEWINGQKQNESMTELEKEIDKVSDRIFILRRTRLNESDVSYGDYRAYIIARTDQYLSFISVEKGNRVHFYYGAYAPQDVRSFSERASYIYPKENVTDPNFYRVYKILSEISEKLYDVYEDYPMSQHQMPQHQEFSKYAGYGLVRVELNENMPESMLEEFMLLLWSSLEENNTIPSLAVNKNNGCEIYLSNSSLDRRLP